MEHVRIEEFRRHLRSLEREIFEQLKDDTSCCGISLAQCHAIQEIGNSQKTNISDLADKLKLDKSTLSRTIEGLVQLGLVSREINPEDRRYMCVTLSEQGKIVYQSINTFCNRYYQIVFSHIHEAKHSQIIESLIMLSTAMQRARESQENSQCLQTDTIQETDSNEHKI